MSSASKSSYADRSSDAIPIFSTSTRTPIHAYMVPETNSHPAPPHRAHVSNPPIAPKPTSHFVGTGSAQNTSKTTTKWRDTQSNSAPDPNQYPQWVHDLTSNLRAASKHPHAANASTWRPIPLDTFPDPRAYPHRTHDFTPPQSPPRSHTSKPEPTHSNRTPQHADSPQPSSSSFSYAPPHRARDPNPPLVKPYYRVPRNFARRLFIKTCVCVALLVVVIGTMVPLGPYIGSHTTRREQIGIIVGVCGGLSVGWGVVFCAF